MHSVSRIHPAPPCSASDPRDRHSSRRGLGLTTPDPLSEVCLNASQNDRFLVEGAALEPWNTREHGWDCFFRTLQPKKDALQLDIPT